MATSPSDPPGGEIDEIGHLEDVEIHDHAEDVKAVRFIGTRGAVEVEVTDHTMDLFVGTAKQVRDSIRNDKAAMRERLFGGGSGPGE